MERLWTPWRRAFVEGASGDGSQQAAACFLCAKSADGEENDRANLIVHRTARVFVVLNMYPYNNGHVMVAPYTHTGDFANLDSATAEDLMRETQQSVAALQQVYRPDAFNVGMNLGKPAGAGLPDHLHMHVVPRWNGDTNFMPVIADTKVLPETLDQTYERLHPLFRRG